MTSKIRTATVFGALTVMSTVFAVGCADDKAVTLDLSPAAERGQLRAKELGCQACHSTTGDGGVGPSWAGLYGSTITLSDGEEIVVDDAYITESIREPIAKKREGQGGAMGAYDEKRLSDADLADIIEFIKELK